MLESSPCEKLLGVTGLRLTMAGEAKAHYCSVLGGPWDLVTTYTRDYNTTYTWGGIVTLLILGVTLRNPFRGIISKLNIAVISGC